MEGRRATTDIWPAFSDFLSSSLLVILMVLIVSLVGSTLQRTLLTVEEAQLRAERTVLQKQNEALQKEKQANTRALEVIARWRTQTRQDLPSSFKVDPPNEEQIDIKSQTIVIQDSGGSSTGDFFKSNETELTPGLKKRLDQVVRILNRYEERFETIRVDGHTDDFPIANGSNWVLSAGRAARVVDYLLTRSREIRPWKIAATGRAEYQPQTLRRGGTYNEPSELQRKSGLNARRGPALRYIIEANATQARQAQNRRIEIHLEYDIKAARREAQRRPTSNIH